MSDESQPPQLRLRPRKRDDEPTAVPSPPAAPAPAAPESPVSVPEVPVPAAQPDAAPAAEAPSRFRLKPKLSAEPEVTLPDTPLVPPAPVSVAKPGATAAPFEGMPGEIPRLKLKPLTSISAPPPTVEPPSVIPSIPAPEPEPIIPVTPAAVPLVPGAGPIPLSEASGGPPLVALSPLPIPPVVSPPPPVVLHSPPKSFATASAAKKSSRVALLTGLAVVVVGVAVYFVFFRPIPPSQATVASVAAPTTSSPALAPLPPAPEPVVIAPLPPPPTQFSPTTQAGSPASAPAAPVVTPAFRAWLESVRVTGVIAGASPKAIINGRLVRPGDMVDAGEGIALDAIDAEHKQLVFRSRSGAILTKSY